MQAHCFYIVFVPCSFTFFSRVDCLLTAKSKARIKTTNYMMVGTIIGCIFAVILGKRQAERGESLHTMRDDWYKEMLAKDNKNK